MPHLKKDDQVDKAIQVLQQHQKNHAEENTLKAIIELKKVEQKLAQQAAAKQAILTELKTRISPILEKEESARQAAESWRITNLARSTASYVGSFFWKKPAAPESSAKATLQPKLK